MTYPQQGYAPSAPHQPYYDQNQAQHQQPPASQQYAPQQPAYAPPQQPYAPAAQGYPAQQYPAQQPSFPPAYGQQPQGYPQGYGQQPLAQPEPQGPPPAAGSLDEYYKQPSTGWGPGLPWKQKPVGTSYTFQVARPITDADIEHQTKYNTQGQLDYYRDGRPKRVMKVPGLTQPDQTFPDGRCQWYVGGPERDELARAMSAAGAPEGPPEEGAVITVTLTGQRPNNFGTLSGIKQVQYYRPGTIDLATAAAQAPAQPQYQQPAQQYTPAQQQYAPAAQAPAQPQYQQPAPPQPYAPMSQQQQPAQPQYQAPAVPQGQPLPPLQPANQQLLQQLTGQPAA